MNNLIIPSLSTSISSPSFFKDRENDEEEEIEEEDELQHGSEHDNEISNNVILEDLGDLGDFNANSLLTSLNELDNEEDNNLLDLLNNNGGASGLLAELDHHSHKSTSSKSITSSKNTSRNTSKNSSVKSIKKLKNSNNSSSSTPKSRSMRIYRTFPYRGSLPAPIFEILNSLDIPTNDIPLLQQHEQQLDEQDNEKPKPYSTNGLRHSRQYKGLNILFESEKDSLKSENIIKDTSFFEPPKKPEITIGKDQQQDQTNLSDLIQSLDSGSQLEEQKIFNTSFDDLSNLAILDGLNKDKSQEDNIKTNDNEKSISVDKLLSNLNNFEEILPNESFSTPTSSTSLPSSPIMSSHHQIDLSPPTGTPSDGSSPKIEENSSQNFSKNKKPLLSRTITFSDPTSILNFFNHNNDVPLPIPENSKDFDSKSPPLTPTSSNNKVSLSTLFPKLAFQDPKSPSLSPSKFYFPLLQPQSSTSLIRGYGVKADINKKGLLRAKKIMDMEDIYFHEYPFGPSKDNNNNITTGVQSKDGQMALFAIFDGHSGKMAAMAAKEILSEVLLKYIQSAQKENGGRQLTDMRGVFLGAFKEIDAKLSKFEYEGSTATVVLIWRAGEQRYMQAANVGDSTAFLSYAGETLLLTKDHRVTDPEEIQRIKSEGVELTKGQTRINGLMVSRALGDHFIKHNNCGLSGEPYISPPINLTPFHTHLVLASDGLWDVIPGSKAMDLIKMERDEEKMAGTLLKCALDSLKSKDNISIIVVTL